MKMGFLGGLSRGRRHAMCTSAPSTGCAKHVLRGGNACCAIRFRPVAQPKPQGDGFTVWCAVACERVQDDVWTQYGGGSPVTRRCSSRVRRSGSTFMPGLKYFLFFLHAFFEYTFTVASKYVEAPSPSCGAEGRWRNCGFHWARPPPCNHEFHSAKAVASSPKVYNWLGVPSTRCVMQLAQLFDKQSLFYPLLARVGKKLFLEVNFAFARGRSGATLAGLNIARFLVHADVGCSSSSTFLSVSPLFISAGSSTWTP